MEQPVEASRLCAIYARQPDEHWVGPTVEEQVVAARLELVRLDLQTREDLIFIDPTASQPYLPACPLRTIFEEVCSEAPAFRHLIVNALPRILPTISVMYDYIAAISMHDVRVHVIQDDGDVIKGLLRGFAKRKIEEYISDRQFSPYFEDGSDDMLIPDDPPAELHMGNIVSFPPSKTIRINCL